jgi:drug/metabolite transporter (DMT)-like permease
VGKNAATVAAALAVTLFAWGMSYVWTKIVLTGMGPFTLVFIRFFLATGLFALTFAVTGRKLQHLSPTDHGRMFLLALLQPIGHFAFETCGLLYTSASAAALIVAAIPLAVLALSMAGGRQRASLGDLARILASAGGVGLVIGCGGSGGDTPGVGFPLGGELFGDLLMVGAVLSTAGYVVLGGALTRRIDVLTVTFLQIAWGAALFLPASVWEISRHGWPRLSGEAALALAALTVLASFAAFYCYNIVLGRLSAARSALWLNAVPVVTTLAAWKLLDERLGGWQILGGLVVFAAVAAPRTGAVCFRPARACSPLGLAKTETDKMPPAAGRG